jgi:hypothetical protein
VGGCAAASAAARGADERLARAERLADDFAAPGSGTALGGSALVLGSGFAATGAGLRAGAVGVTGAGAVTGAATGAAELARSPGEYTGGSSNTVYSRMRRP